MERRDFLKAGVAGLGSSFVLGGLCLPGNAQAATVVVNLTVEEVIKTVPINRDILTWQFINASQPGPGVLGSGIVVNQGDIVTINIQNNLSSNRPVNLIIPGIIEYSLAAPAGGSQSYTFIASTPGSYVYCDNRNGQLSRAMGLIGPLLVLPNDGSKTLTPTQPDPNFFDRDYTLVLHEMDSRINDAVAAGLPFDINNYQPDIFLVNGLSYPNTVYANSSDIVAGIVDDSKVIYMLANEHVAIRFINGGLIYYPMHFHGYHVNVVARNRNLEEYVVEKDTVLVKPGETVDSILSVGSQTGLYPLHTHYIPGVTNNGSYAGGCLLMMKAV